MTQKAFRLFGPPHSISERMPAPATEFYRGWNSEIVESVAKKVENRDSENGLLKYQEIWQTCIPHIAIEFQTPTIRSFDKLAGLSLSQSTA